MRNRVRHNSAVLETAKKQLLNVVAENGVAVISGLISQYDRLDRVITVNSDNDINDLFTIAHEVGHMLDNNASIAITNASAENGESIGYYKQSLVIDQELAAWDIGLQFIPELYKNSYWCHARMCLKTYRCEKSKMPKIG